MIEYAIPSRARAAVLVAKTMPLLDRLEIPHEARRVFVAEPETGEYRQTLDQAGYGRVRVERGAQGMAAQRNAIHGYYPEGTRFVSIDDDLRDLVIARDEKTLEPIPAAEWELTVGEAFAVADQLGARLWGLYPVANPFFMKQRINTKLSYIGGGLWGCVNRNDDAALTVTLEDKEDFERSLRCYDADRAVVRVEYVTWKTTGYEGKGGMQQDGRRTHERILASAERLARAFPRYATLNLTKKSGKPELRLRAR